MNTNGILMRVNSCPLVVTESANDELFGSASRKRDPEWVERDFAGLRLLFHSAQESERAHEMHDRGVCNFDAVSDLLSDVSCKSGQDGFQGSGVVSPMVFDSVIHAHSFGGGNC